jgi:hypothetical protein
MYLKVTGCEAMDWLQLAHDGMKWRTVVDKVINLRLL